MKETKVNQKIIKALFELLESKELDEISRTELISKAGICRSSYYRHFYFLEDVIKQYAAQFYSTLSELPSVNTVVPRFHLHLLYEQYYKEKKNLTILNQRNLLYLMDDPMYEHCKEQLQELGQFQTDYQVAFYSGSFASIIKTWIRKGFLESPDELTNITFSLIDWDKAYHQSK